MATFTHILAFAFGVVLGGFVVAKFNPKDITYQIKKLRAKNGGVIDIQQEIEQHEPEKKRKRKLFNKLKHRKHDGDFK